MIPDSPGLLAIIRIAPDRRVDVLELRDGQDGATRFPDEGDRQALEALVTANAWQFRSDAVYQLAITEGEARQQVRAILLRDEQGLFVAATVLLEEDGTVSLHNLFVDAPVGRVPPQGRIIAGLEAALAEAYPQLAIGRAEKIYLSLDDVFGPHGHL